MAHAIPQARVARDLLDEPLLSNENSVGPQDGGGDLFASSADTDPSLFDSSNDLTLPLASDDLLASTVPCDGSPQSSLDLFSDPSAPLDARDLADEFGLTDLTGPLQDLENPTSCLAPNSQQPGPSRSNRKTSNRKGQKFDLAPEPLAPGSVVSLELDGDCGGLGPLYRWALRCDGVVRGDYVHGCDEYGTPIISLYPRRNYCCREYDARGLRGKYCIEVEWPQAPIPGHVGDTWGYGGSTGWISPW